MKRFALVLALVAMGACKRAEQQPDQSGQMAQDTSHMMMSDTAKMAADTTKQMAPAKQP